MIDFFPALRHSVSFTTRPARPGETDGVDYHFVSQAVFDEMVRRDEFVEWAEVHGNRYGTARRTLDEARASGQELLLEIDWQGAAQLRDNDVDGVYVFILPPSFEDLGRRLEGRGTDSADVIEQRLQNARRELAEVFSYDYLVINDDFDHAVDELKSIVIAERCRTERQRHHVNELFPSIAIDETH